jgi:hypothetical protein
MGYIVSFLIMEVKKWQEYMVSTWMDDSYVLHRQECIIRLEGKATTYTLALKHYHSPAGESDFVSRIVVYL